MTHWHLTFGTYGTRLHGDARPTVDREHNRFGTPFVTADPSRLLREREAMAAEAVVLTSDQRGHVERTIPSICERGGWSYRIAAAPEEGDHVHVLLAADPKRHGKEVRRWLKQWLTASLNERWPRTTRWWAHGGSTKAVKNAAYLRNVLAYIARQRSTPLTDHERRP
ncbi:MAG: transposase [Planctomycetota bacterium]